MDKNTTSAVHQDPTPSGQVGQEPAALDENVEVIKSWEREVLLARSRSEQLADWIASYGGQRSCAVASRALVHLLDLGQPGSDSWHRAVRSGTRFPC